MDYYKKGEGKMTVEELQQEIQEIEKQIKLMEEEILMLKGEKRRMLKMGKKEGIIEHLGNGQYDYVKNNGK